MANQERVISRCVGIACLMLIVIAIVWQVTAISDLAALFAGLLLNWHWVLRLLFSVNPTDTVSDDTPDSERF